MRRPRGIMPDVTKDRIDAILEPLDGSLLALDAKRSNVATGDMRSVAICDGLTMNLADLRGQSGYEAQFMSGSGLSLEIRLEGQSRSYRATDRIIREIGPGTFALSACRTSEVWNISAPSQEGFRTVSFTFSLPFLDRLADSDLSDTVGPMLDNGTCQFGSISVRMQTLAEQLLATDLRNTLAARVRLHAASLSLLADCVSACLAQPPTPAQTDEIVVALAKDYIGKNANRRLKIADVAAHCRLSPSSLKLAFCAVEGVSLGRYIRDVRMQSAKDMIEHGVSIADAARALNYSAPEALTRAFSKYFGHPPSRPPKV